MKWFVLFKDLFMSLRERVREWEGAERNPSRHRAPSQTLRSPPEQKPSWLLNRQYHPGVPILKWFKIQAFFSSRFESKTVSSMTLAKICVYNKSLLTASYRIIISNRGEMLSGVSDTLNTFLKNISHYS